MNHNHSQFSSKSREYRELDCTQKRAQKPRHNARRADVVSQSEIDQILSPYWASRAESEVHTGSL